MSAVLSAAANRSSAVADPADRNVPEPHGDSPSVGTSPVPEIDDPRRGACGGWIDPDANRTLSSELSGFDDDSELGDGDPPAGADEDDDDLDEFDEIDEDDFDDEFDDDFEEELEDEYEIEIEDEISAEFGLGPDKDDEEEEELDDLDSLADDLDDDIDDDLKD
ncbi:hypothetical protein [Candidatus Laterigemmans baculatus]|uniref:hypothetical protein n=1 Tax=Candidatus Laterigemmans baculatus TaxID=2770505 RepID=UPI00193C5373|nr:hypothetical protein [Candidatus Laterigemmans baculatus]